MTTSTENNPIYFQVLKGWMATHQGRMPGVVPTPGEPEDHPVVDTPYMDDVAKNGISPWGRNRGPNPTPSPLPIEIPISMAHPVDADPPPHDKEDRAPGTLRPTDR